MTSGHPAHKPAELFRSDLISAMKLPDSTPMEPGSFLTIREPWRTEWEFGVQVCVSPGQIPEPQSCQVDDDLGSPGDFELPSTMLSEDCDDAEYPMYDLDELDLNWLDAVNQKRKFRALAGANGLTEDSLREALVTLETKCQQNMARAIATEENLGIEFDEQTVCDVCQDHESEETNDMIFCDVCNVCVHQACYGISSIPKGSWLCKVCASGEDKPQCLLCSNRGGALKRVRPGNTNWAHLSCALWIPEVRLGNADKMEPITNVEAVPLSRWNLLCCLCRTKQGACIQCSHPSCAIAYHVTCGFQQGLIMKSRLDMVKNTVVHESFCPKHTAIRKSPSRSPHKYHMIPPRPTQLIQLQESFYKYTSADDLVTELKMSHKLGILIYNYWKLKRRSQHNRTLLSHLPIETSLESIKAELAAGNSKYAFQSDEDFMKIVHIRQNLEKARNLIYMVQRRERLKKQILYNQANHWDLETELLKTGSLPLEENDSELKDEVFGTETDVSVRQTRSMTLKLSSSMSPPLPGDPSHAECTEQSALPHTSLTPTLPNGPTGLSALETQTDGSSHSSLNDSQAMSDEANSDSSNIYHHRAPHNEHTTNHKHLLDNPISKFNLNALSETKVRSATPVNAKSKMNCEPHPVNGTTFPDPSSKLTVSVSTGEAQVDGLVMRSGRGPSLRHRPYTVNHKTASEFS